MSEMDKCSYRIISFTFGMPRIGSETLHPIIWSAMETTMSLLNSKTHFLGLALQQARFWSALIFTDFSVLKIMVSNMNEMDKCSYRIISFTFGMPRIGSETLHPIIWSAMETTMSLLNSKTHFLGLTLQQARFWSALIFTDFSVLKIMVSNMSEMDKCRYRIISFTFGMPRIGSETLHPIIWSAMETTMSLLNSKTHFLGLALQQARFWSALIFTDFSVLKIMVSNMSEMDKCSYRIISFTFGMPRIGSETLHPIIWSAMETTMSLLNSKTHFLELTLQQTRFWSALIFTDFGVLKIMVSNMSEMDKCSYRIISFTFGMPRIGSETLHPIIWSAMETTMSLLNYKTHFLGLALQQTRFWSALIFTDFSVLKIMVSNMSEMDKCSYRIISFTFGMPRIGSETLHPIIWSAMETTMSLLNSKTHFFGVTFTTSTVLVSTHFY